MAALDRFLAAQDGVWSPALAELRAGAKRSHWMLFVFPQLAGLGHSPTARFYAIADLAEARAYLAHPVLCERLLEATEALAAWAGKRGIETILGPIDALKFVSSMTLFEAAAGPERAIFSRALDAFGAPRDARTLARLGTGAA